MWRKGFKSSFVASSTVGLVIGIHLLFVYSLVKQFSGWTLNPFLTNYEYGIRKWIMIIFIIPIFFGLDFFYFRKRKETIFNSYKNQNPFTLKNIVIILLVMLVPFVLTFVLN